MELCLRGAESWTLKRFEAAGGLEDLDIVKEFLIKMMSPVLDRYFPLSYKIGDYIHRKVARLAGIKTV